MGRKTVATVIGTRPNFIKYAALQMDLDWVEEILIHTGQHYTDTLSKQIWDGLGLREPNHVLNCGHKNPSHQFECMIREISLILKLWKPDFVLVIGDCNSTLGGALAASFLKIPVIHIEAGLRCFDMNMPEERNRKLVDHIAQVNFCISECNARQIIQERSLMEKYHAFVVGDLLYDTMLSTLPKVEAVCEGYYLATVHREENAIHHIKEILDSLEVLNKKVIFPKHPRVKVEGRYNNIDFMDPVDYVSMLRLLLGAEMVFTDSGGLQREAVWLGKPCVLLRTRTEFPEFVSSGHVFLAGPSNIRTAFQTTWAIEPFEHDQDGKAGKRIMEIIHGL